MSNHTIKAKNKILIRAIHRQKRHITNEWRLNGGGRIVGAKKQNELTKAFNDGLEVAMVLIEDYDNTIKNNKTKYLYE